MLLGSTASIRPGHAEGGTPSEEDRAEAIRVRDAAQQERDRFLEDHRRALEERRRREEELRREQQQRRIDPERNTFWRREQTTYFGRELLASIPAGKVVVVYAQKQATQFFGYRGHFRPIRPNLRHVRTLQRDQVKLSDLLRDLRGNFAVLVVPEEGVQKKVRPGGFELLSLSVHGNTYDITNIFSDGSGFLRVEAEQWAREGEAGPYYRWAVDSILLEYR